METKGAVALRRVAQERGLSKSAIARAIGVSHPTVIDWMRGYKRPSWPNRFRIRDWSDGTITAESWDESAKGRGAQ